MNSLRLWYPRRLSFYLLSPFFPFPSLSFFSSTFPYGAIFSRVTGSLFYSGHPITFPPSYRAFTLAVPLPSMFLSVISDFARLPPRKELPSASFTPGSIHSLVRGVPDWGSFPFWSFFSPNFSFLPCSQLEWIQSADRIQFGFGLAGPSGAQVFGFRLSAVCEFFRSRFRIFRSLFFTLCSTGDFGYLFYFFLPVSSLPFPVVFTPTPFGQRFPLSLFLRCVTPFPGLAFRHRLPFFLFGSAR